MPLRRASVASSSEGTSRPSNTRSYGGSASSRRSSRRFVQDEAESGAEEENDDGEQNADDDEDHDVDGEAGHGGDETMLDDEQDDDDEDRAADADGAADGEHSDGDGEARDEKLRMPRAKKMRVENKHKRAAEKIGREEINRRANDLVRFALFCEYRRAPIRRDDISKKVLGSTCRAIFPIVFNKAAKTLRKTFGVEFVELRARGTENEQILAALESEAARSQAAGKKRRRDEDETPGDEEGPRKAATSKSYALRSLLPEKLIRAMQVPIVTLAERYAESPDGHHDAQGPMLDWRRADGQLGAMGLLFVILSLILLNGRTLPDDVLRAQLKTLSLEMGLPLPTALRPDAQDPGQLPLGSRRARASHGGASMSAATQSAGAPVATGAGAGNSMTLDGFLTTMCRQLYLETVSSSQPAGATGGESASHGSHRRRLGTSQRRSDVNGGGGTGSGNGGGDEARHFEWRWGSRAEAEIGERAVARFVAQVFYAPSHAEAQASARSQLRASSRSRSQSAAALSASRARSASARAEARSSGGGGPGGAPSASQSQSASQAATVLVLDDDDEDEDDDDDDDGEAGEGDGRDGGVGGSARTTQRFEASARGASAAQGEEQQEEQQRRQKRSQRAGLMREIERAAGSQLIR